VARDGRILAQFAYPLEPRTLEPAPGKLGDNGMSEILALPDGRLLVLERAGAQDAAGKWRFAVRLFAVDFSLATDVARITSLAKAKVAPGAKRLVFDGAAPGQPWVDNLEGLARGRRLRNGHDTLVVVSDDNFSISQETQFWVFEIIPDR
jgi:hypothetical protein